MTSNKVYNRSQNKAKVIPVECSYGITFQVLTPWLLTLQQIKLVTIIATVFLQRTLDPPPLLCKFEL